MRALAADLKRPPWIENISKICGNFSRETWEERSIGHSLVAEVVKRDIETEFQFTVHEAIEEKEGRLGRLVEGVKEL
jgi:hypothetical protein